MAAAAQRDPRSIITPAAFQVAPELLGTPLAPPRRRLLAILVDLVVIFLLAAVTRSSGLLLAGVISVALVQAALKPTSVPGSVFTRAMRLSVAALGVLIGLVTVAIWLSALGGDQESGSADDRPAAERPLSVAARAVAGSAIEEALEGARTTEEAEVVMSRAATTGRELGLEEVELRELLLEAVPDRAAWAADAPGLVELALAGGSGGAPESIEPRDARSAADEVSLLGPEEALEAYAALLRARRSGDGDPIRLEALRARVLADVAADTLRAMDVRYRLLESTAAELEEELAEAEEDLEEADSEGIVSWVFDLLDELGFGFGWTALYMTVAMAWWNGFTVGKRLLGIRVVRLDGKRITWWTAFERVGGYVAGFATGLLGFAQVYWDANRQAIHDRIVGTVVVRVGAERVPDWESAQ
ncbi:MAG TPA: RDD family protein [Longimicrobiales bacterium]|nr:RDD family protein [Longimicrobiales bacterium]